MVVVPKGLLQYRLFNLVTLNAQKIKSIQIGVAKIVEYIVLRNIRLILDQAFWWYISLLTILISVYIIIRWNQYDGIMAWLSKYYQDFNTENRIFCKTFEYALQQNSIE